MLAEKEQRPLLCGRYMGKDIEEVKEKNHECIAGPNLEQKLIVFSCPEYAYILFPRMRLLRVLSGDSI